MLAPASGELAPIPLTVNPHRASYVLMVILGLAHDLEAQLFVRGREMCSSSQLRRLLPLAMVERYVAMDGMTNDVS
jgi:hypothetical protein